jgi:small acid-soluble spore protein D (minor alpha/beta-type SASP)
MARRNRLGRSDLDGLKFEVAEEIGYFPEQMGRPLPQDPAAYRAAIDKYKYEVAAELGIPLRQGDNGDLTSRQAGQIGGHIGGRLGGQMVRRMIRMAEEHLARGGSIE